MPLFIPSLFLFVYILIALSCEAFRNQCIIDNAISCHEFNGGVDSLITVIIVVPAQVDVARLATRIRLPVLSLAETGLAMVLVGR